MYNKGFTLMESVLVLCLVSFLLLLTSVRTPPMSHLSVELQRIKELLIRTQLHAMITHEKIDFQFTNDALCIQDDCYPYAKHVTSDTFSMNYYEDGTISQAKTICFYQTSQQKCLYIQLGSGYIDIR